MEFNLDKVKGFLGQLKDKAPEVAGTAVDKAKDAAKLAKLTMDMNTEKEALKIYAAHCDGDTLKAIALIEQDRKAAGVGKYLDFARKVNNHQCVMSLWRD